MINRAKHLLAAEIALCTTENVLRFRMLTGSTLSVLDQSKCRYLSDCVHLVRERLESAIVLSPGPKGDRS